jgi:RNA polymerase sigma factor (sigma-70 family)
VKRWLVLADQEMNRLVREASDGNPESLTEVLAELRPMVVRVTRLIVGPNSAVAEDAAQEALIDISNGIGSLREPEAIRSWARRLSATRALKVTKHERLRRLVFRTDLEEHVREKPEGFSEELRRAFYRLPPKTRAVAVLRLYVGLSEAETAAVLECSVGTVKSQLYEARSRLARQLPRGREESS